MEPFKYASASKRVVAFFIDSLIILFCYMAIGILFSLNGVSQLIFQLPIIGLWWYLGMLLLPWMYYALFESSKMQATVGKYILGLQVTTLTGERLSFGRATGRYFGKFLSQITLGYLLVLMTKKKQALHDKLASTIIIHVSSRLSEESYSKE
ncbi:MAG TPA: RDD family protein [Rhabdochlamydiaceae bacterium]|nr:RDD family protein [Rhabdochlamydiaceae bacterium]